MLHHGVKQQTGWGKRGHIYMTFCSELITETLAYLRGTALYLYLPNRDDLSGLIIVLFFRCNKFKHERRRV